MARDRSLRLTFTAVSAGTNINAVRTALGTSTAVVKPESTASNYFFGYSDPENLNGFASILGDAAGFSAQANASADASAAPLSSSTAPGTYHIRTAVGQSGFSGPRPQMFTVQSASSSTSTAPSQTADDWASCGSNIFLPATCSVVTVSTDAPGAGNAGSITTTNIPVGSIVRVQSAGTSGLSANTHYIAGSAGTAVGSVNKLHTMTGALVTTTSSSNCVLYVNTPSNPGTVTVTGFTPATGEMASTAAVEIGDAFIFTNVTGTTWAVETVYFVNGKTANGFTLASTAGGATLTTGTITASSTGFVYRTQQAPLFVISNNTLAGTLTSRLAAGGTAIYHGLSVGDVLVLHSGTVSAPSGITAASGDSLIVKEIVSPTEFKVAATYGGDVVSVTSASSATFYPMRNIRVLPIQMDKMTRQWIRLVQQNFNGSTGTQTGYTAVLYADVCPGRDGSYTLR